LEIHWLRDGQTVAIRNAQTYFGKLSYEIRSKAKEGRIEMSLDPPTRNAPSGIVVRFRHPEEKPIRSVSVNGKPWQVFDPAKGDIRLASKRARSKLWRYTNWATPWPDERLRGRNQTRSNPP
jgi:hypothetical protein